MQPTKYPNSAVFVRTILLAFALCAMSLHAGETKPEAAKDEAAARETFSKDYEAGTAAIEAKNWALARTKFSNALKVIGDLNEPRKTPAQVLMNKANNALIKDDASFTATELQRLKQWVEAEEAWRKVVEVYGETETIRNNVLACRAGLEGENEGLKKANALLKDHKWKEAIEAFNKAADTLGGIRVISEGLNAAKAGLEAEDQVKKAGELLTEKKWDEAFNIYKKLVNVLGETEEIKKGLAAAQAGYAADHPPTPATAGPTKEEPKKEEKK